MGFVEIAGAVAVGGTVATIAGNLVFAEVAVFLAKKEQKKQLESLAIQFEKMTAREAKDDKSV